jgi:hypothetical protein
MKARLAFFTALALILVAIMLICEGRGYLEEGYRLSFGHPSDFLQELDRVGMRFYYASIPFSICAVTCVLVSRRRREPVWRWTFVLPAAFYVLLLISPA